MVFEEKLGVVEEAMDVKKGTLKATDLLENYDEWDSLAALSIIAFIDKQFNKVIGEKELKKAKTVQDIINLM